jgi:hypothetical protein
MYETKLNIPYHPQPLSDEFGPRELEENSSMHGNQVMCGWYYRAKKDEEIPQ